MSSVYVNAIPIGGYDSLLDKKKNDMTTLKNMINSSVDTQSSQQIKDFEKEYGKIPNDLKEFYSISKIQSTVFSCYPCNNSLVPIADWEIFKIGKMKFIKIMIENQYLFYWYIGWKDGKEGKVYVSKKSKNLKMTDLTLNSNSLSEFFITYILIGKAWWNIRDYVTKHMFELLKKGDSDIDKLYKEEIKNILSKEWDGMLDLNLLVFGSND